MIKRFIWYIVALNLVWITGCVSQMAQGPAPSGSGPAGGTVVELPERVILNHDELPGDVELVLAALINAIRNSEEKIPNISFDPDGTHEFLSEPFDYKGFDVEFVDIIHFKTERSLDHVRYALLECGLYFADAVGRSAYVRVQAGYAVAKSDIIITHSEYEILPDPYPTVYAFIVPKAAVENAPAEVKASFAGLYLLARQAAVDMEPTDAERIRHEQYEQLSFMNRISYKSDSLPESYRVMIFCMNRLRAESRFVMTVSKDEKASGSSLSTPYYLNDNGWMVGIAGGKFALDAYGKDIYFHVQYNPGIDPANTELKPVARFSTIKNYHFDRNSEPVNPYLETWKRQGIQVAPVASQEQGPVASGTVFLNPAVIEDAKIIQQQLADLGYYALKVDGAFGKGSRRALSEFKKATGLGEDSQWDLETQKALFKSSSL